jgi:hypothetical protein
MRVDNQRQAPAALPLETRSCTHYTGDCVGHRAGRGMCGKLHPPEFDPQTVQPVASHYTDWAIPAYSADRSRLQMIPVYMTDSIPNRAFERIATFVK